MASENSTVNNVPANVFVEGPSNFVEMFCGNYLSNSKLRNFCQLSSISISGSKLTRVSFYDLKFGIDDYFIDILNCIATTIKNSNQTFDEGNIIIQSGITTFTIAPNVAQAIRTEAEITYIAEYKLRNQLDQKTYDHVNNQIDHLVDPCTIGYKNGMISADRYHFPEANDLIAAVDITEFCNTCLFLLNQYSPVEEVKCLIRATGYTQNKYLSFLNLMR